MSRGDESLFGEGHQPIEPTRDLYTRDEVAEIVKEALGDYDKRSPVWAAVTLVTVLCAFIVALVALLS